MCTVPGISPTSYLPCLIALGLWACVTGCAGDKAKSDATHWQSVRSGAYHIQRVLLLPLQPPSFPSEAPFTEITLLLAEALQRSQLFAVTVCPVPTARERYPELNALPGIAAVFLLRLAQEWGVQAVVLGHITHYRSWPSTLGLKFDIVSTYDGTVLWAVDGIWQDDRLYVLSAQPLENHLASLSAKAFIGKVCTEAVQTMISR
jgi:hypothetical protein